MYVYEPLTEASFNKSMLYKYNNKTDNGTVYIKNAELRTEYGKETLKIELNNDNIFNYIDVKWHSGNMQEPTNVSEKYATFNFGVGKSGQVVTGSIGATLVQFGIQYPIYCGYEVREPIISEQVVLENDENIHSFKSGGSYINLKAGDQVDIKARAISSKGLASVQKFNYFICNNNGYKEDSVATIDLNGCLQALSAGRVKLIIVASDALKTISTSDYFKTGEYIYNNAYVMIDVLVSDGSQAYPYLIASVDDFKAIQSGDSNHYALVNDINLNGISFNISEFKGVISSYQETAISNNRFNVYGVMLDETNPTLFAEISQREDVLATGYWVLTILKPIAVMRRHILV